MKVKMKRFVWEDDVCLFATQTGPEKIISICWDGNNEQEPWVVWYKEKKS